MPVLAFCRSCCYPYRREAAYENLRKVTILEKRILKIQIGVVGGDDEFEVHCSRREEAERVDKLVVIGSWMLPRYRHDLLQMRLRTVGNAER